MSDKPTVDRKIPSRPVVVRTILVSGDHFDTVCEVQGPGPGVTIRQSSDSEANPGRTEDVIALSFEEWQLIEDHVATVRRVYGNHTTMRAETP